MPTAHSAGAAARARLPMQMMSGVLLSLTLAVGPARPAADPEKYVKSFAVHTMAV